MAKVSELDKAEKTERSLDTSLVLYIHVHKTQMHMILCSTGRKVRSSVQFSYLCFQSTLQYHLNNLTSYFAIQFHLPSVVEPIIEFHPLLEHQRASHNTCLLSS